MASASNHGRDSDTICQIVLPRLCFLPSDLVAPPYSTFKGFVVPLSVQLLCGLALQRRLIKINGIWLNRGYRICVN
jgi:hypothetical protein